MVRSNYFILLADLPKEITGNTKNIQLSGLSAGECFNGTIIILPNAFSTGAHSVHQLLHHVSLLPEGEVAPFQVAILQSNAILSVFVFISS